MKFNNDEKRRIRVDFTLVFLGILVYFLFLRIEAIFSLLSIFLKAARPIILGLSLAFILNMLLNGIEKLLSKAFKGKKKGLVRTLSLVLTYLVAALVLFFMVSAIIPQVVNSIVSVVNGLPDFIDTTVEKVSKIGWVKKYVPQIEKELAKVDLISVRDKLIGFVTGNAKDAVSGTLSFVGGIFSSTFEAMLVVIFSVYVLSAKQKLADTSKKVIYTFMSEKWGDRMMKLARVLYDNFYGFFTGQFTEALLVGVLTFVFNLVAGMPYAVMIAVIVGFLNIVPYFGSIVGALISALFILTVSPVKALIFIIFIVVLQQIDGNLIYPRIVGDKVGVPSYWVMVSITIGGALMGILGMIVFVPLMASLYSIVKDHANVKLREKNIDIENK